MKPAPSYVQFQSLVETFYASHGLEAIATGYMQIEDGDGYSHCYDGDSDECTDLSRLRVEAKRVTKELDGLFLQYLCFAIDKELAHIDSETANFGTDWELRERIVSALETYSNARYEQRILEHPDLDGDDPSEVLAWLRLCYLAFSELSWTPYYGGSAWATITEAAIIRLERKYGLTPGNLTLEEVSQDQNLEDLINNLVFTPFCAKPEVFVDYILDLQHNTGSCLNKGWLQVDIGVLMEFQSMKRYESPVLWAESKYPKVCQRIRARMSSEELIRLYTPKQSIEEIWQANEGKRQGNKDNNKEKCEAYAGYSISWSVNHCIIYKKGRECDEHRESEPKLLYTIDKFSPFRGTYEVNVKSAKGSLLWSIVSQWAGEISHVYKSLCQALGTRAITAENLDDFSWSSSWEKQIKRNYVVSLSRSLGQ